MSITTPQLEWPPRLTPAPGGGVMFAELEQDTADEIRRSGHLILNVRPGQLPWAPTLGTPNPLGSADPEETAALLEAALRDQEPRAPIRVTVADDQQTGRSLYLRIEVLA